MKADVRAVATGAMAVLVAVAAPGCGGYRGSAELTCANPPSKVVTERPVEVPYEGPSGEASALLAAPAPRLVIQVTNSQPSVERVRLAFDGEDALDVDLPAGLECGGARPVYSIAYDWPPGPVEVELDLQGSTSTSIIEVPTTGTVWAVVDVQSQREWGDLKVYETQPGWG